MIDISDKKSLLLMVATLFNSFFFFLHKYFLKANKINKPSKQLDSSDKRVLAKDEVWEIPSSNPCENNTWSVPWPLGTNSKLLGFHSTKPTSFKTKTQDKNVNRTPKTQQKPPNTQSAKPKLGPDTPHSTKISTTITSNNTSTDVGRKQTENLWARFPFLAPKHDANIADSTNSSNQNIILNLKSFDLTASLNLFDLQLYLITRQNLKWFQTITLLRGFEYLIFPPFPNDPNTCKSDDNKSFFKNSANTALSCKLHKIMHSKIVKNIHKFANIWVTLLSMIITLFTFPLVTLLITKPKNIWFYTNIWINLTITWLDYLCDIQ